MQNSQKDFLFSLVKFTELYEKIDLFKIFKKNENFEKFKSEINDRLSDESRNKLNQLTSEVEYNKLNDIGKYITPFDTDFPSNIIGDNIQIKDLPFILFFKGNLNLLKNIKNNIAVIGMLKPDDDIKEREKDIVKNLVKKENAVIVSGLARGCDTVAHQACIEAGGKTIAILPTPLFDIYPKDNIKLAKTILDNDGLLISEYYYSLNYKDYKFKSIQRFIDRDRLQALFSEKLILIASPKNKNDGDIGSKYASHKAIEYNKSFYVMYDEDKDKNCVFFDLNKKFINNSKLPMKCSGNFRGLIQINDKLLKNNKNENTPIKQNIINASDIKNIDKKYGMISKNNQQANTKKQNLEKSNSNTQGCLPGIGDN